MTLAEITRDAVEAAIREFDRLGRQSFLDTYGSGPSKSYFLDIGGKLYDSKAIVGFAHGVHPGPRLSSEDFTGGESTVARTLERLGFAILVKKRLDWMRDEVILACDLVWLNGWRGMAATDKRVIELSQLLQIHDGYPVAGRPDDFRNPNGVARKTHDIATRHPDYSGAPTKGGKTDLAVLEDFRAKPEEMHQEAEAIRAAIRSGESMPPIDADGIADLDLGGDSAAEGGVLERMHLRRERDRGLRNRAVAAHKKQRGFVACEACGFNFGAVYGRHGEDFIECHHKVPLSESGPTETRLKDLALLCSNCHRMIHRVRPWLTFEQLVAVLGNGSK